MNTIRHLLLLSLPLLLGCDSQVETDYQGEALATISGQITTSLSSVPDTLETVVIWSNSAASPDTVVGQSAPVTGSFPAAFELNLFVPPPEGALNDYTFGGARPNESHIGVAYIAALPVGVDISGEEPMGPVGVSERYMLVYVQEDIQPGTQSEQLLGEALAAGYYLMDVIDVDDPACPGEVFDCLRRTADGMEATVDLNITDQEIDAPNWT